MISAMVITLRAAQASPMTAAAATSSTSALVRPARSLSQACIDQLSSLRAAPSNLMEVKNVARCHPCCATRLTTRSLAASSATTLTTRGLELG
jgi:hypothetical protein